MDSRQVLVNPSPTVAVVGMATIDYLYVLDSHPDEDSENPVRQYAVVVGGPAGRGAIAAARLGDGGVSLHAMCGSGVHAEVLRQELGREPIDVNLFERDQISQHSAVIVAADHGTRSTMWLPQPAADSELLHRLPTIFDCADTALLDCTDAVLSRAAVTTCRDMGVPVVMDTGGYKETSEDFLSGIEYIVAPEKFFTKRHPGQSLDSAMQRVFEDFRPQALVATQAALGGTYLDGTGSHRYRGYPVDTKDSCGAGDTFHGALAWAIAAGSEIGAALDIASWSAALKCAVFGNDGIPDRLQLKRHLAESGQVR
ncbi:PfkB family carbohydrate kinase [Nocardia spumae]|uniref:PfkB family carbohydrate kinase n=1 Tax=Nocardia spumae TaxID=2887190 RepID=UPI001D1404B3|nr:PfkB family carbohydrate kinase [Nocardia spumae]